MAEKLFKSLATQNISWGTTSLKPNECSKQCPHGHFPIVPQGTMLYESPRHNAPSFYSHSHHDHRHSHPGPFQTAVSDPEVWWHSWYEAQVQESPVCCQRCCSAGDETCKAVWTCNCITVLHVQDYVYVKMCFGPTCARLCVRVTALRSYTCKVVCWCN